jgi:hypothetical protein
MTSEARHLLLSVHRAAGLTADPSLPLVMTKLTWCRKSMRIASASALRCVGIDAALRRHRLHCVGIDLHCVGINAAAVR